MTNLHQLKIIFERCFDFFWWQTCTN